MKKQYYIEQFDYVLCFYVFIWVWLTSFISLLGICIGFLEVIGLLNSSMGSWGIVYLFAVSTIVSIIFTTVYMDWQPKIKKIIAFEELKELK